MGVAAVCVRHDLLQRQLDLERIFAGRQPGAVADAEQMRVDRDGRLAERDVEHDVRGLAADARQRLQRLARCAAPCCHARRSSFCDSAITFFALVRKSPMVLISSRTLSSPSATIFSGVSAAANSAGVALLTPASVACADSTTATSSVNGLTCLSSPLRLGIGLVEAAERFLDLRRASSASLGR